MGYESVLVQLTDQSEIGAARRRVRLFGEVAGFDEAIQGRLAIVATELATNVLRHAGRGQLLLHRTATGSGMGTIDLVSIDNGPGIGDIERALTDGFSTAGTPGNGLGAARRLADKFDIWSLPDRGTVVLARFHAAPPDPAALRAAKPLDWAAVSLAVAGETVSGDAWRVDRSANATSFLVVDGLGHGPSAALAAEAVAAGFLEDPDATPDRRLAACHRRAQGSRGAAAAVARIRDDSATLQYAGIGNIAGRILANGDSRGMMSLGGIVGSQMRTLRVLDFGWPDGALLILHSDGIQARWDLNDYPKLQSCDPILIVAVLLRDFRRERDDATVLVARSAH